MELSCPKYFRSELNERRFLWNAILAKSRAFIMNSQDILWQVENLLWKVKIFMMTGQYFRNDKLIFYCEQSRFSWCQVEILLWTVQTCMMTHRDFIMNGWDFHDDRLRFYYDGRDLYDDRSRFYYERSKLSWWQVDILVMKYEDFYNDRLTFS